MTHPALLDALAAWHDGIAPPAPPQTMVQFAKRIKVAEGADLVDGAPQDLHPTPAQLAIWGAWDAGWGEIAALGPIQDGKTLACEVVPALYQLAEDRRPVLLAHPRQEDAAELWRSKIWPAALASGLDCLMPSEGKGARKGVPDSMLVSTGTRIYLRGAGGANEAQQSMITARAALITEVDSIALAARNARRPGRRMTNEGRRRLELLKGRTADFQDQARVIYESTLKLDIGSAMVQLWERGTQGRLQHQCPHCGAWSTRERDHLTYDDTSPADARSTAALACPHCSALLTPEQAADTAWGALDRHQGQQLVDGRIQGQPLGGLWSIWWSALDSPRRSLAWLAAGEQSCRDHLRRTGDHDPLRQWYRDHWARPYLADHDEAAAGADLQPAALAARSAASDYDRGEVPLPNARLSLGVDVQLRELWWIVVARSGERLAIVDAAVEYLCGRYEQPSRAQRIEAIQRLLARVRAGYPGLDAQPVPSSAEAIDLGGGGWLDEVDAALRADQWRAWGCRGEVGAGNREADAPLGSALRRWPAWGELFRRQDGRRCLVVATAVKARILRGLSLPTDQPGAVLLPRGLGPSDHLCRHLCAEKIIQRGDGRLIAERRGPRADLLDAATYADAVGHCRADLAPAGGSAGIAWG